MGHVALERIGRLSDEDVVAHLVQVRGIGVWTAEMFLISNLGRLDVWPVGDLGVRAGYARAWQLGGVPRPKGLMEMGELYRPYRTVVAWYCWQCHGRAVTGLRSAGTTGDVEQSTGGRRRSHRRPRSKTSWLARDGARYPLTLRTYCSAAALTSVVGDGLLAPESDDAPAHDDYLPLDGVLDTMPHAHDPSLRRPGPRP